MTSTDWSAPEPSLRDARRNAAFRSARRHTLVVVMLRKAIPIAAVVAVMVLIVTPFLNPLRGVASVSMGAVGIANGKVKMETPRLGGYRKDNRPYEVIADAAYQDIRNPTQVELSKLTARLQMEREGWVDVTSKTGHFDTQGEKLKLIDDVRVKTETGYDVSMRIADIDFKAGTVVSKEPVKVSMGTTTIDADTLDVKDNGQLIVFQGRVRAFIGNAPAGTLAGPERAGSTPAPELLRTLPVDPQAGAAAPPTTSVTGR